jgi:hypothetical protein
MMYREASDQRGIYFFINNLASSFTWKLKGRILFTSPFLEEIFDKFLSNWEKKLCYQYGEYTRRGKTHEEEFCYCHVQFQTDRQTDRPHES